MKVNTLRAEGLVHEYEVTIAAVEIQNQVNARLKRISATAQMPGFRPGKVPFAVVEKRYGVSVLGEVVEETVNTATMKTMSEKGLRPAAEPKVEFSGMPNEVPATKDLVFKMEVELIPEIQPADFSQIMLEKLVVETSDADLGEALERVAKGNRRQQSMGDDYGAQMGDVVVLDFDGAVDGVRRDGMKGSDFALELGSNRFIPGFEEKLVGIKAGEERNVDVTFPADYYVKDLAAKAAVFAVEAKSVNQLQTPALDDQLAKDVGLEDLAALTKTLSEQIAENYNSISRGVLKRHLMDKLAELHSFPVPPSLLNSENESLWKQVSEARAAGQLDEEDKNKSEAELKEEYGKIAERRVRLGLLLSEIARKHKIEVGREDVRKAIMQEAMKYRGQEKEVVDYFTKNAQAREQLTAPMLEEKVVDFILSKAQVAEKKTTREELAKAAE